MEYKVIYPFLDAKDGNHLYEVGDKYPRPAMNGEISAARFAELAGDKNLLKRPLIAEVGKVEVEKPVEKKKAKAKDEKPVEETPAKEEAPKVDEEKVKDVPEVQEESVDVAKLPFFKLKSLAKSKGIDVEGKSAAELREEVAKVM